MRRLIVCLFSLLVSTIDASSWTLKFSKDFIEKIKASATNASFEVILTTTDERAHGPYLIFFSMGGDITASLSGSLTAYYPDRVRQVCVSNADGTAQASLSKNSKGLIVKQLQMRGINGRFKNQESTAAVTDLLLARSSPEYQIAIKTQNYAVDIISQKVGTKGLLKFQVSYLPVELPLPRTVSVTLDISKVFVDKIKSAAIATQVQVFLITSGKILRGPYPFHIAANGQVTALADGTLSAQYKDGVTLLCKNNGDGSARVVFTKDKPDWTVLKLNLKGFEGLFAGKEATSQPPEKPIDPQKYVYQKYLLDTTAVQEQGFTVTFVPQKK